MQRHTHTHSHTHLPLWTLARLQTTRMGSVPLSHLLVPSHAASTHKTHTSSSPHWHTHLLANTLTHSRKHRDTLRTELAHKGKAHSPHLCSLIHESTENKEHTPARPFTSVHLRTLPRTSPGAHWLAHPSSL